MLFVGGAVAYQAVPAVQAIDLVIVLGVLLQQVLFVLGQVGGSHLGLEGILPHSDLGLRALGRIQHYFLRLVEAQKRTLILIHQHPITRLLFLIFLGT